jgi:hypothetical protein
MAYSSIAKPTDYFNTVLYTGNGSTNAITGVGFQPDWLWVKCRSNANGGQIFDALRTTNSLSTNETAAEADRSGDGFTSLDSDGFTMNGSGSGGNTNASSRTYVAWNWLAGNSTSSNSDGGTSSTVSVNTTAGLSVVGWAGAGSATTVGHGLGVAPKVVLVKNRSEVYGWQMYHESLGNGKYLSLNNTDAVATSSQSWNDTSPTSSVFSVGASDSNNKSGNNIIAYCLAEKQGYSKFGSYTGNGNADGTFVYTGFKPAWVMIKKTSSSTGRGWYIWDNKRIGYNVKNYNLEANAADAEDTTERIDLLSNGFKWRSSNLIVNESGINYIFLAFAENPFVGNDSGTAVPVTAR